MPYSLPKKQVSKKTENADSAKAGTDGSSYLKNHRITDPHTVCYACVMVRKQADTLPSQLLTLTA